jgi:uncharacterized protein with von Willebrand factor type A (vWA) domain
VCVVLAGFGCRKGSHSPTGPDSPENVTLPKVESRPGTAIVILVDTSGSMAQPVADQGGQMRPKNQIAKAALENIVDYTAKWKKDHPDRALQLGIFNFSSSVFQVLPVGDFQEDKARAAVKKIPAPSGGTAIGRALEEGYRELYRAGLKRKFIVCITDGENTSGPLPERVARQLYAQTGKEVEMHFVAFDTSAEHFKFLNDVNGYVVEAADGNKLQTELSRIYEKRIIAEMPLSDK